MKDCYDIILKLVEGKDVLDIGSCSNQGGLLKPKKLFYKMKMAAKSIVGIDIEGDGKEIIKGNAEIIKLNKKFDMVIAGDVIEHLDNAGLFLDNMNRHLKKNGFLILVTPNAKAIGYLPFKGNRYHTCWYCRYTLRHLIEKYGFVVRKEYIGLRRRENYIQDLLRHFLANNILFICQKCE